MRSAIAKTVGKIEQHRLPARQKMDKLRAADSRSSPNRRRSHRPRRTAFLQRDPGKRVLQHVGLPEACLHQPGRCHKRPYLRVVYQDDTRIAGGDEPLGGLDELHAPGVAGIAAMSRAVLLRRPDVQDIEGSGIFSFESFQLSMADLPYPESPGNGTRPSYGLFPAAWGRYRGTPPR